MIKSLTTVSMFVLATVSTAPTFAQTTVTVEETSSTADEAQVATTAEETPGVADEMQVAGDAADETPSAGDKAQAQDESIGALTTAVKESADRVQAAVERFGVAMADAKNESANIKALEEMLEAARGVNESLNKDSDIWVQLEGRIEEWTEQRDSANERARENPGMQPTAELWQDKVDLVVELRILILDQATDSEILTQDIENKKEVISEYYKLDQVDRVLDEMTNMKDELTSMNESMRMILEKTVGVEEGQVPTTN